jgi:hypothetical protein
VCQAGLNDFGTGLLIHNFKDFLREPNMSAAACSLRDTVNSFRDAKTNPKVTASKQDKLVTSVPKVKVLAMESTCDGEYVKQLLALGALQFGSFTLKSGRVSPYFFNSSAICSGQGLCDIGR